MVDPTKPNGLAYSRLSTPQIRRHEPRTFDVPRFSGDEISIYRDFLLHYPEQPDEMIGVQDTTVAFVASTAFGDESNPLNLNLNLNLEIPVYSGRKLPPEIMALTDEDELDACQQIW